MTMARTVWFAALASVLAALPLRASAAPPSPSPSPNVYRSLDSRAPRAAGIISGRIEMVDYSAGIIRVRGSHGVQVVALVPSTTIYRGSEYATLSDLRSGQFVEIALYEAGGRLVAASIRLK